MPPQGILTIAAYAARRFDVRVVDENATPLTSSDLAWADAVFVSGMHPHKRRMAEIARAAHEFGKLTVAGGPSVSGCPSYHPDFDILHVGELGDATDDLLQMIETSVERPAKQTILQTKVRLPIEEFPIPAYDKIDLTRYMVLSIQWSSGCPFTCEFCDIPELYGRNPRFKSAERLTRELNIIMKQHPVGAIWFVDDNLIGNSNFDDDESVEFSPPKIFTVFNLTEGTEYPKSYFVTLILAEVDMGGLSEFVNNLLLKVKDEVTASLTAAGVAIGSSGGPVGAIIGLAVGYVVGKVFDLLKNAWEDDVFSPVTIQIDIPSLTAPFPGGRLDSNEHVAKFEGHGGYYRLAYDWRVLA